MSSEERRVKRAQQRVEARVRWRLRWIAAFGDRHSRKLCRFCLESEEAFDNVCSGFLEKFGYGDITQIIQAILDFIKSIDWAALMEIVIDAIKRIFDIFSGDGDDKMPQDLRDAIQAVEARLDR